MRTASGESDFPYTPEDMEPIITTLEEAVVSFEQAVLPLISLFERIESLFAVFGG